MPTQIKQTKHTPLPWRIGARDPADNTLELWTDTGKTDLLIGLVAPKPHYTPGEQEANAALIIRAVNSHHELLEALQGLLSEFETVDMNDSELNAMDNARNAIAKARGEEECQVIKITIDTKVTL